MKLRISVPALIILGILAISLVALAAYVISFVMYKFEPVSLDKYRDLPDQHATVYTAGPLYYVLTDNHEFMFEVDLKANRYSYYVEPNFDPKSGVFLPHIGLGRVDTDSETFGERHPIVENNQVTIHDPIASKDITFPIKASDPAGK